MTEDMPSAQLSAHPTEPSPTVELSDYDNRGYRPGRGRCVRGLWYICNAIIFSSWFFPLSGLKQWLLRVFGAKVGKGVVIKPRVNVKYPWHLHVGNHVWIGEGVWIDNLVDVTIGNDVCVSQGVYLLTGNHDYKDRRFGFLGSPIHLADGSWVGAFAVVCPGSRLARNSIVTVASVLRGDTEANGIYAGNPASRIRERTIKG
jgi:putative colanic acid biosynthesis acetyltransferase WcaF